ncbi:MAG: hypothetical protein ABIH03_14155, partial [Pseudomonadota bacterium]
MTYNTMILHSAATADANGPSLDCEGYSILGVQITGTFVAVVYFEGTVDGTNWVALEAIDVATGAKATSAAAVGIYRMGIAGLVQARARLDWTSGTSITVKARLSDASDPLLGDTNLSVGNADASASNPVPTKGFLARFDVALSLDTNIYAANDLLADTQAVASVFLNGNPVVLYDLRILDEDDQGQAMDILFLRSNTTLGTENNAYAPTDAMGREILKKVSLLAGDFVDEGAFRTAYKSLVDGIGCVLQPT